MDELPPKSQRWRRFVATILAYVLMLQVIGWLLWRDSLTTRLVPAIISATFMAWYFTFGPPWRRR
jgi:hypothetical protein